MAYNPTLIAVPEGYIHRETLRNERGWSTQQMDQLTEKITVDVGSLKNVSNKAYPLAEVHAVEAADPALARQVKKHMDAAASYIPPTPGVTYNHENTLGEAQLRARGWSPAHITRLLHHHDLAEPFAARTMRARYGTDRVEQAEATDTRLGKSIKKHRDKALTEYKSIADTGGFIFRSYKGQWYAWGRKDAAPINGRIEVQKKDGSRVPKLISYAPITDPENPDYGYFKIRDLPAKASCPAAPAPAARMKVNRKPVDRIERVDSDKAWVIGDVIPVGEKTYTVRYINKYYITSDDPSVYGPHLLGHEDSWGYKALAYPISDLENEQD